MSWKRWEDVILLFYPYELCPFCLLFHTRLLFKFSYARTYDVRNGLYILACCCMDVHGRMVFKSRLPSDDNGDDWKEDDGHVRWGPNEQGM